MQRRLVVAVVLVALLAGLAGCADTSSSLSMQPVDDEQLAAAASQELPEQGDAPPGFETGVVRRAIENGSATTVALEPPVETDLPYRHEGQYYELSHAVEDTESGILVDIQIDFNASSVEGEVVAYGDLPGVDRQRLLPILQGPRRDLNEGPDFGAAVTYGRAEANRSVLVTDQRYDAVRYQGEVYPITIGEPEEVTLRNYRYEATLVGESAAAYGASVREQYAFELSGLSDAESSVVESARNGSYFPDGTDDQGFADLVDRFREREPVTGNDHGGSWVVRHDGQVYWVELDFGAYGPTTDSITPPDVTPPPE